MNSDAALATSSKILTDFGGWLIGWLTVAVAVAVPVAVGCGGLASGCRQTAFQVELGTFSFSTEIWYLGHPLCLAGLQPMRGVRPAVNRMRPTTAQRTQRTQRAQRTQASWALSMPHTACVMPCVRLRRVCRVLCCFLPTQRLSVSHPVWLSALLSLGTCARCLKLWDSTRSSRTFARHRPRTLHGVIGWLFGAEIHEVGCGRTNR